MKILLLTSSFVKGGIERQIMELVKGLKSYPDISCELVLFSSVVEYKEVYDLDIPIHMLKRKPKKDPRIFYQFYQLCKKLKPDIIHSWSPMPSVYAVPASKLLGIKLLNGMIQNAPNNLNMFDKRYLYGKLSFPFSDVILANSKAGLKSYRAPSKVSSFIYNGYDFDRLKKIIPPEDIRQKFGIHTKHVVGMIGAFADRKDYYTYIQSAIQILEKRNDITFLAVGDGKNREAIMSLVPEDYKKNIIFTGLQSQVESIINIFDIGVLATNDIVHGEGISNAIIEYMVLGKPVVASDTGGTKEIVSHGETGYIVSPRDPNDLAKHIGKLIDSPQLSKSMGEEGSKRIRIMFPLQKMVEAHYHLYHKLFENRAFEYVNESHV